MLISFTFKENKKVKNFKVFFLGYGRRERGKIRKGWTG